jgi:endonuclease/exonuclease/phosphatase family metal-dependent hydrolase
MRRGDDFSHGRIVKGYGSMRSSFSGSWLPLLLLLSIILPLGLNAGQSSSQKREEVSGRESVAPQREIRILTINVWSGLTYKGFFKMGRYPDDLGKRYELLVRKIRRLDPDIVAIQEANPLPRYAERLAADLDHRVIFGVALGGIRFGSLGIPINLREGDAMLVKKPWTIDELGRKSLGGWGIVTNWFCFHFGEITQALLGRAVVNGKPLYIYTVHLHAGPFHGPAFDAALERLSRDLSQEKAEEAKKTAERDIERRNREIANLIKFVGETLPADMPAIILGDFNTTEETGELAPLLTDGKWADSYRLKNPDIEGVTWDPHHNPNFHQAKKVSKPYEVLCAYHRRHSCRIDFILVSPNVPRDCILGSRVVLTPEDGCSISDHYGVLTTLKW